jgi:N-acetylglucosamine-6-sulfatase
LTFDAALPKDLPMGFAMRRLTYLLVLTLGVTLLSSAPPTGAAAPQPNIVFILVDDAAAITLQHMSQTRTLIADRGATLTQFVYNQPLCCPSRATMLRGQYSQNTGVVSNDAPDGGYSGFYRKGNESSTLATWFDAAGYTTGYLGKYLNGYPGKAGVPNTHVPAGYDRWFADVGSSAENFDYIMNDDGVTRHYGTAPTDYSTDVLAAEAQDFIQHAPAPFLLTVAPNAPHWPAIPAPRHEGMFADAQYPRTPSFNEEDVTDKPSVTAERQPMTTTDIAAIDAEHRLRLESLQAVDEMVRRIVDTLDARNLLADTYLLLASDNGYLQGEHLKRGGKNLPYEEATTVPLYIRGPGIPAGSSVQQQVGNVDLPVTLSEAAGITPPNFVDGRSFLPLVQGSSIPWRQSYLLGGVIGAGGEEGFAGIRTDRYTYAEYFTGEGEFYDRSVDPHQLVNTYPTMDPTLKAALHDRLLALKNCSGSECRDIEEQALP